MELKVPMSPSWTSSSLSPEIASALEYPDLFDYPRVSAN